VPPPSDRSAFSPLTAAGRQARVLIVGASRGIGAAAAAHFAPRVERLWSVSRTPPGHGEWIPADVSSDAGIDAVRAAIGGSPLDALLHLGGTWEAGAFTDDYRFDRSPPAEIRRVLAVNLIAPILLAQALAPNLARAPNPRVVVIGARLGRDGIEGAEVANTASKAGLRGAVQALGRALRPRNIGVTLINPGNVATPEVEADIAEGRFGPQTPIPMDDLLATIVFSLSLSADAVAEEIDLAQKRPA
jgi:3-oxoacyl-[acyl-carrier protein] reductase